MNERERFGALVRARREELGLSQRAAWKSGGPSAPVWTEIESGSGPEIQGRTLAKLDRVLWWQPGSAKRALAGGEPVLLSWEGMDVSDLPPLSSGADLAERMAWNHARALLEGRSDLGKLAANEDRVMRGAQAVLDMAQAGRALGARPDDLMELVRGALGVLVSSGVIGSAQNQFPRSVAKYLRDMAELSELIADDRAQARESTPPDEDQALPRGIAADAGEPPEGSQTRAAQAAQRAGHGARRRSDGAVEEGGKAVGDG